MSLTKNIPNVDNTLGSVDTGMPNSGRKISTNYRN